MAAKELTPEELERRITETKLCKGCQKPMKVWGQKPNLTWYRRGVYCVVGCFAINTPWTSKTSEVETLFIPGKRFGYWTTIAIVSHPKQSGRGWLCLCKCGTERVVSANTILSGGSKSCGCNGGKKFIEQVSTGQQFGDWLVLGFVIKNSRKRVLCKCVKCGIEGIKQQVYLLSGRTKNCQNCGIIPHNKLSKQERLDRSNEVKICRNCAKEFRAWYTIKVRNESKCCSSECSANFNAENYYFIGVLKPSYNEVWLTAFGETKSIREWFRDDRCKVSYKTLWERIRVNNWGVEEAIMTPVREGVYNRHKQLTPERQRAEEFGRIIAKQIQDTVVTV